MTEWEELAPRGAGIAGRGWDDRTSSSRAYGSIRPWQMCRRRVGDRPATQSSFVRGVQPSTAMMSDRGKWKG
jgi:hypothetical protein